MRPSAASRRLLAILLVLLGAAVLHALCTGSVAIGPGEVLSRCARALWRGPSWDFVDRILLGSRLPRVLVAAAVGATLALAGLAAQTLFRNPLASPYVAGISSGSALGAVAGMLLIGRFPAVPYAALPAFSIATGLAVTGIVFALGRRGDSFGHSLLLAGIAIGALCSSLTSGSLYLAGERLQTLVFWLMGGFWRAGRRDVLLMLPVAAATLMTLLALAPAMNVALLGERSAHDLGVRVRRLQAVLLATIAVSTAVAVSIAGVIGFVGLVVPHVLRRAVGGDHRRLVPLAAVGGALLLVAADTLARTVAAPTEVPVGILTSLVGAPVFLWILQRRAAGRSGA